MAIELFRIIGERKYYVVRDDIGRIVVSDELLNSLLDNYEKQIPKKAYKKIIVIFGLAQIVIKNFIGIQIMDSKSLIIAQNVGKN